MTKNIAIALRPTHVRDLDTLFQFQLDKEGGYTLFNAALTYEYEKFVGKLRVNNLTGKRYDSFSTYASYVAGNKGIYPGVEEDVQLSVGYRF